MAKAKTRPARCFTHPRSSRLITDFEGPSMTKTDEAPQADVNNILKRFDRSGVIIHLRQAEGVYADVSELGSYQEAMQTVIEARRKFDDLPSGLRRHFGNDPAQFVDWATAATPAEKEELYAGILGLNRYVEPTNDSPNENLPETSD